MPDGNKLKIMEGDTSNVALDPINNANSKALQAQASMGSFIMNQNMSAQLLRNDLTFSQATIEPVASVVNNNHNMTSPVNSTGTGKKGQLSPMLQNSLTP